MDEDHKPAHLKKNWFTEFVAGNVNHGSLLLAQS